MDQLTMCTVRGHAVMNCDRETSLNSAVALSWKRLYSLKYQIFSSGKDGAFILNCGNFLSKHIPPKTKCKNKI